MSDPVESRPRPLGEHVFKDFSWPDGRVPPVLAGDPIPVKVGFIEDLKAILPPAEHEGIQTALARWTRGFTYQYALLAPGAKRHDLDGNPVEDVSEKQRDHARATIKARQLYRACRQFDAMNSSLDAIERMFGEPTRENLAAAKKAAADIRRILHSK